MYFPVDSFSSIYRTTRTHYRFPLVWFYHEDDTYYKPVEGPKLKTVNTTGFLPIVPLDVVARYLNITVPEYLKGNLTMLDLAALSNRSLSFIQSLVENLTVEYWENITGPSVGFKPLGLVFFNKTKVWMLKVSQNLTTVAPSGVLGLVELKFGQTYRGTLKPLYSWTVISALPVDGEILVNKHTGEVYITVHPSGGLPFPHYIYLTTVVLYGGYVAVTKCQDGLPVGVKIKYVYRYRASVKVENSVRLKTHLKNLVLRIDNCLYNYTLYAEDDDWKLYKFGLSPKGLARLSNEWMQGNLNRNRLFMYFMEGFIWVYTPPLSKVPQKLRWKVQVNPSFLDWYYYEQRITGLTDEYGWLHYKDGFIVDEG